MGIQIIRGLAQSAFAIWVAFTFFAAILRNSKAITLLELPLHLVQL